MDKLSHRQRSLSILSECLTLISSEEDASREPRLDDVLAEFTEHQLTETKTVENAAGWYFCLRPCFRAALDIKQTPRRINKQTEMRWTQGSRFHFSAGDTLYDSPNAYRPWNLGNFRCCIEVTAGVPAQPPTGTDRIDRNPGSVVFHVLVPDTTKRRLIQYEVKPMNQDDFVRMLIIGPPDEWTFL